MKKINVNVSMEVEITDEEYEKLRSMAFGDERAEDNPYKTIRIPEWLAIKVTEKGKLIPESGIIYADKWIKNSHNGFKIGY